MLIADDWGYGHAGCYGDSVVRTPNIDRLARSGMRFTQAFCTAPSCSPSRASILTGRYPHQLREGANLWGFVRKEYATYPARLRESGYHVGLTGKGYGPGDVTLGGYTDNPAGKSYKTFAEFLSGRSPGQPFCFWFGSTNPHRPYATGAGLRAGLAPAKVRVPAWLPDTPEVRADILDYYQEIEQFDAEVGTILTQLEATGELARTLIVVTSDNGMPFPHAKTNVYDSGARMPFIVHWPEQIRPGQVSDALISLVDVPATFLSVAGLSVPSEMASQTLLPLLRGQATTHRSAVFIERERHTYARAGNLSYPVRAIRTDKFLYVRNLAPERWPAGDPILRELPRRYADIDGESPSREQVLGDTVRYGFFYTLAAARRPAEELYDLRTDAQQLRNVAHTKQYKTVQRQLASRLVKCQQQTTDPRLGPDGDVFSRYPYTDHRLMEALRKK